MKENARLYYLKHGFFKRLLYRIRDFICWIPRGLSNLFKKIYKAIKGFVIFIKEIFCNIFFWFIKGTWRTKVSYFIMGFGNLSRGQILRGILFLAFQTIFIIYMLTAGCYWLSKLDNLGDVVRQTNVYIPEKDTYGTIEGDNSWKILLYCILTIFFIIAYIYTWYQNIKQNKICDDIIRSGKKIKSGKDDLRSLVDDQFHKTLLALPLTGILFFTLMPIIFMIIVAFTNYDAAHDGYSNLFTWVGWDNFNELIGGGAVGGGNLGVAFGEILGWTLIWAFFATFTNYFLGMAVAMLINKKGIRGKKIFRCILVMTIAVPQFVSLLYISKMFSLNGVVNYFLKDILGWTDKLVKFWEDPNLARVMVILINIWVGIPYLMLITSGVLMNIPQDLYESSKIDGANVWQQYRKITLPYMLFVTGPYLLTSFVANINNFNVIYLLTGSTPADPDLLTSGGSASKVDLLITWLFKITLENGTSNYKIASVIGILVFLVIAVLSLIIYNVIPSTRQEEDFS